MRLALNLIDHLLTKNNLQMKAKHMLQYILLLSFCLASCTSTKEEVTLAPTLSTKSFADNRYAIPEKEIVLKAEQFLIGIKNSMHGDSETRSTVVMNLHEKEPQVETIIRYIEYKRDEMNNYDQVPVYIINYPYKKSKAAGGFVILTGDKRIKNNILVYSDAGSWDNENPNAQNFLFWFWANVDKLITEELAENSWYPTTKSYIPPECLSYYCYTDLTLSEKRLPQITQWHQDSPFGDKLIPMCNFYAYGSMYPPVGCVAVAMAQIMAHHKKPTNGSYIDWLGTIVNTTYNWTNMLTSPNINSLNPTYKEQVQHLMAEIGYRVDMIYTCTDSNPSDMNNLVPAFGAMGYSIPNSHVYYQYSTIVSEINANRPVFAADINHQVTSVFYEHAWMIDGYSSTRRVETITVVCPNMLPYEIINMYDSYFAHCNMGHGITSGLGYNGYYNSLTLDNSRTGIFTHIQ